MNMSQKKTEKSGQKKRGFSALFGKSSLEFGRLYPNIDETTTKNSTKERETCHPSGFREVCTREREI